MATAKLRGLSAADFERLADLTNLQAVARVLAREYFVQGKTLTDIARDFNTSKQRVSLAVGSIRRVYEASASPSGQAWLNLEEAVPEGLSAALAEFLAELRKKHAETSRKQAIDQVARALERATWSLK